MMSQGAMEVTETPEWQVESSDDELYDRAFTFDKKMADQYDKIPDIAKGDWPWDWKLLYGRREPETEMKVEAASSSLPPSQHHAAVTSRQIPVSKLKTAAPTEFDFEEDQSQQAAATTPIRTPGRAPRKKKGSLNNVLDDMKRFNTKASPRPTKPAATPNRSATTPGPTAAAPGDSTAALAATMQDFNVAGASQVPHVSTTGTTTQGDSSVAVSQTPVQHSMVSSVPVTEQTTLAPAQVSVSNAPATQPQVSASVTSESSLGTAFSSANSGVGQSTSLESQSGSYHTPASGTSQVPQDSGTSQVSSETTEQNTHVPLNPTQAQVQASVSQNTPPDLPTLPQNVSSQSVAQNFLKQPEAAQNAPQVAIPPQVTPAQAVNSQTVPSASPGNVSEKHEQPQSDVALASQQQSEVEKMQTDD